jgi:hypothetical protein
VDVDAFTLDLWAASEVDVVRALGFQMVGDTRDLGRVGRGVRDRFYNKVALWRPKRVAALHSFPGNHDAQPEPAESLKWAAADMYHFRYAAPDAFAGLDAFARSPCAASHEARTWLAHDALAAPLFGPDARLPGLGPCAAPACARSYDRESVAAAADAEPPECRAETDAFLATWGAGRTRTPQPHYFSSGARALDDAPWSWSLSHLGQRAWPPYATEDGALDDGAWRTPTVRVALDIRAAPEVQ